MCFEIVELVSGRALCLQKSYSDTPETFLQRIARVLCQTIPVVNVKKVSQTTAATAWWSASLSK